MKRFLCVVAIITSTFAEAQTVTVTKQTSKVKNESADGYTTELAAKRDEVSVALNKYLKESGKAKSAGDMITVSEPVVGGTPYAKGFIYGVVTGTDQFVKVWIGIIGSEWNSSDVEPVTKELEQLVYRFGVKFYRDKIQLQIDEAQQASDAVDRQAQRLISENKSLTNKLSNNDQEKIRLEKSLEENKLEDLVLKQKLVNNKKAQDSIAQASVKVKAVVEMHKERQRKVN